MTTDPDLLSAMLSLATDDTGFTEVLQRLAVKYRCRSAALIYVDPCAREADVAAACGVINESVIARYRQEFAAIDPAPAAMALMKIGEAAATDRIFDRASETQNRFLNEFYYPLGLAETLGGPIANEDGRFGILAVHRGPDRSPFSDEEISAFGHVLIHMSEVMRLRSVFFELRDNLDTLANLMEPLPAALMAFDRAGVLRQANAAARAVLNQGGGLSLDRSGRLLVSDRPAAFRIAQFFNNRTDDQLVIRVAQKAARQWYGLRLTRLPDLNDASRFHSTAKILIAIHDPSRQDSTPVGMLSALLNVPLPCARLIAAIVEGETLAEFAARNSISLNTVKYHLKTAHAAVGVRRQAELVQKVTALLRDLGSVAPKTSGLKVLE